MIFLPRNARQSVNMWKRRKSEWSRSEKHFSRKSDKGRECKMSKDISDGSNSNGGSSSNNNNDSDR